MKYYLIWKRTGDTYSRFSEPSFVVEHKEVAEHFCNQNNNWYYYSEHDTEEKDNE